MEYPVVTPQEPKGKRELLKRQTLTEWITDICKVKECRDGFVSKEVKGYETLFACPYCDRNKRDLYPYQAIPTAKKWKGSVDYYTDSEMKDRSKEREQRAEELRNRAARTINWDQTIERIGKI